MSTHLAELTSPQKIFDEYPHYGLFEIDIRDLREFGLVVKYMPEAGIDHAGVFGLKGVAGSVKEKLAKRIIRAWEPGSQQLVHDLEAGATNRLTQLPRSPTANGPIQAAGAW